MYVLIDITNCRPICKHESYKACAAMAVIQFANVDAAIVALGSNKGFAILEREQVKAVGLALGVKVGSDYAAGLRAIREAIEADDVLALPFTLEQMERQAYAIAPNVDYPMAYDVTGDVPKRLPRWHFDPQRNRKRSDSSFGHVFSAGLGYGPGVVPPTHGVHKAAPGTGPRAPAMAPPKPGATPPKAPPAKRAPAAPSGPATRPKGGSTARVWELADLELSELGSIDMKALRKAVIAACEAEGINSSTASVQYGKWKSSKGL